MFEVKKMIFSLIVCYVYITLSKKATRKIENYNELKDFIIETASTTKVIN